MPEGKRRGWAGRRLGGSCAVMALGLVLLTACGSGDHHTNGTGSANRGSTTNASGSTSNSPTSLGASSNMGSMGSKNGTSSSSGSTAACDPMTKVTISEHTGNNKDDQYSFLPVHVTIKAGQFVSFDNQSDEIHVLTSTPDAGLIKSAIDRNEDQPVQFTKVGTYTLESQDAKHRGTMQVTVTSAAGTTCGMSSSVASITFAEKHAAGKPDVYALRPKTVNLTAGQSVTLINQTGRALNFACKPSADMAEGNLRVDMNEQQVVSFVRAGQYACASTEAPAQTVTIAVH